MTDNREIKKIRELGTEENLNNEQRVKVKENGRNLCSENGGWWVPEGMQNCFGGRNYRGRS